jgi:hypothetical protein
MGYRARHVAGSKHLQQEQSHTSRATPHAHMHMHLQQTKRHGAAALPANARVSRRLRVFAAADVAPSKVLDALYVEDAAAVAAVQDGKQLVRRQLLQPGCEIVIQHHAAEGGGGVVV